MLNWVLGVPSVWYVLGISSVVKKAGFDVSSSFKVDMAGEEATDTSVDGDAPVELLFPGKCRALVADGMGIFVDSSTGFEGTWGGGRGGGRPDPLGLAGPDDPLGPFC